MATGNALAGDLDNFIEKQLLPKSASSLRLAHRATAAVRVEHFRKSINTLERLYLKDLMETADAVEGIRSFVEKRQPEWKNA